MNISKISRTANAIENADTTTATSSNMRPDLRSREQIQENVHNFTGSIGMSDALRTIVWITGVAFGVFDPRAFAQSIIGAGERQTNPMFQKLDPNHDGVVLACAETQKPPAVITVAQTSVIVNEDKAQLEADMAALRREEMQFRADQKMMNSDTKKGRMEAESKDAEKLYQDQMGFRGEKKDIAAGI